MASDSQVRKQSRITGASWMAMSATLLSVNMQSETTILKNLYGVNSIASLIVIKLDFPTYNYKHEDSILKLSNSNMW